MSIGKLIAVAAKAAAKNMKAAAPANAAKATGTAAKTASQGAERTAAYTDKLGRHYANGRAIKGKGQEAARDPRPAPSSGGRKAALIEEVRKAGGRAHGKMTIKQLEAERAKAPVEAKRTRTKNELARKARIL